MMSLKLKNSIVFKDVNEDCIYAVDCLGEDESFYQFEGPAKIFMEALKEGQSKEDIIKKVLETFEGCTEDQVIKDWDSFVEDLGKFDLIEQ
jgi:hypothetical protein